MNEYEKAGLRIEELHEYLEVKDRKLDVLSDALKRIGFYESKSIDKIHLINLVESFQIIARGALNDTGYPPVGEK